jgi:hypothetical protein
MLICLDETVFVCSKKHFRVRLKKLSRYLRHECMFFFRAHAFFILLLCQKVELDSPNVTCHADCALGIYTYQKEAAQRTQQDMDGKRLSEQLAAERR